MWVEITRVISCYNLIDLIFYRLNKGQILNWGISWNLSLSLGGRIDIDSYYILNPLFEFGHFLSRELVPASWDVNGSIVVQNELSILEPPSIIFEPLLFVSYIFGSFDVLFLQKDFQLFESLHFVLYLSG